MSKPSPFKRGYDEVREKVLNNPTYNMSCFNCEFYYKTDEDNEEVCQNSRVLKYDMVVTRNNIVCNQWELTHKKTPVKSLFKKGKK